MLYVIIVILMLDYIYIIYTIQSVCGSCLLHLSFVLFLLEQKQLNIKSRGDIAFKPGSNSASDESVLHLGEYRVNKRLKTLHFSYKYST
jgi:hypothetical protein